MSTTLRDYTKNVFASGDCSDFSIFVFDDNGTKVEKKVHKFMLRRSSFFSAMLGMDSKEAQEGRVTITHISNDTMEHVLKYLYTDDLSILITTEQAIKIASAADYLHLDALKKAAIHQWKKLIMAKDSWDALCAFRTFANASLRIVPSDPDWLEIMELVLTGMIGGFCYKVADESNAFIEFIIGYFGSSHPYLSMDLLAKWTLGEDTILTDSKQQQRKKIAAELIKKIDLQKMSIRTLAKLSKSEAYPSTYMLQQIQNRSEGSDDSVSGEVVYIFSLTKNRTVELEHETGYVLFQFKGFFDVRYKKDPQFWRYTYKPVNCAGTVAVLSPHDKAKDLIWWEVWNTTGSLGKPYTIGKLIDDNCAITIKVTLKNQSIGFGNNLSNSQVHHYTPDFEA